MRGQIRPEVRKARNRILRHAFEESAISYRQKFIGQTLSVLWESTFEAGKQGWQMQGLTGNYLRVNARASSPRWNEVDEVELVETSEEGVKGALHLP